MPKKPMPLNERLETFVTAELRTFYDETIRQVDAFLLSREGIYINGRQAPPNEKLRPTFEKVIEALNNPKPKKSPAGLWAADARAPWRAKRRRTP